MDAAQQLKQLDREFNRDGSTMHLSTYGERRAELLALAADEREAAPGPDLHAPKPAERPAPTAAPRKSESPPVTFRALKKITGVMADLIGKKLWEVKEKFERGDQALTDLEARVKALEERPQMRVRDLR